MPKSKKVYWFNEKWLLQLPNILAHRWLTTARAVQIRIEIFQGQCFKSQCYRIFKNTFFGTVTNDIMHFVPAIDPLFPFFIVALHYC
jgi:hypothetical protein